MMGAVLDTDKKIAEVINIFLSHVNASGSTFGSVDASHATQSRRVTGRLDENDVKRVLGSYVPPSCQEAAELALAIDHMVVLEGPPDIGKRSAGIVLLHRLVRGSLVVLSPLITLSELAEREYEAGCGYLVDHLTTPDELGHTWGVVRDAIRAAGAFLVVTAPKPADVDVVTVVQWERPLLEDVLRSHLPGDENAVARLREAFPSEYNMTGVAKAAARVMAGATVEDVLTDMRDTVFLDDSEVLLVTTLVFSGGVPASDFESRLAALKARMPDVPTGTGARLIEIDESGVRRFRSATYPFQVLKELTERQPKAFWNTLPDWLNDVVQQNDLPISVGLATLARLDLVEVERSYLTPWSMGESGWRGQTTAVLTLWTMCDHEPLTTSALRIVRDWAQGTAIQRQTAAVALSGELSVRFPADAVREIWRLLEGSTAADEDMFVAAVARLFATLEREGDDGGLVLDMLGRVLNGADERVMRSVLAVLSVRSDGDLAIRSLLDREPDRTDLVGTLWSAALRRHGLAAVGDLLAGVKGLTQEQTNGLRAALAKCRIEEPTDDQPPVEPVEVPSYPVVDQRLLDPVRGRLFWKRRTANEIPRPQANEVFVYEVAGAQVLSRSERATKVSVVDMTMDTPVVVGFPIRCRDAVLIVRITFTCSVRDPVRVVADGPADTARYLHSRLTSRKHLFDVGHPRALSELDVVQRDVAARVRAFLQVRPVSTAGLLVCLTDVEVLVHQQRPSAAGSVREEDAC